MSTPDLLDWRRSIAIGDKVEAKIHWSRPHAIAEIKQISNENVYISFIGYGAECNRWKSIQSIEPLFTNTPKHDTLNECDYIISANRCAKCNKKCCNKCFTIHIYNKSTKKYIHSQCKDCYAPYHLYTHTFKTCQSFVFTSIYHHNAQKEREIEINIILLITKYSFGDIKCGNQVFACGKTIKLELPEINGSKFNIMDNPYDNLDIIACNTCHQNKQRTSYKQVKNAKCKFFHKKEYLQKCIDLNCKNLSCNRCDKQSCNGIKCQGIHCGECRSDIFKNKCNNCNYGFLCNKCDDGLSSVCDGCNKQICSWCRKQCGAQECPNYELNNLYLCINCYGRMDYGDDAYCFDCGINMCLDCTIIRQNGNRNRRRKPKVCPYCINY